MVGWSSPPAAGRNGIIITYIVQLTDTHGAVIWNETVAVPEPTFDSPQSHANNFTSLKPYTNYTWNVAATTTAGAGPFMSAHFHTLQWSEFLHFVKQLFLASGNRSCSVAHYICTNTTGCIYHAAFPSPNIAPGPVSELSYEENTDTSVTITWKPPKEPNGDLVAYFVEHGVYQNESTRSVAIDARRRMSTVIQALGELLLLNTVPTFISKYICQPLNSVLSGLLIE